MILLYDYFILQNLILQPNLNGLQLNVQCLKNYTDPV